MRAPVVQRIEVLIVDLPTIRPHTLAMRTMRGQTLVLLKFHCSDSIVGIGEATTVSSSKRRKCSPKASMAWRLLRLGQGCRLTPGLAFLSYRSHPTNVRRHP
ncbi:hypothetical protein F3J44_00235 [Pantoea sp. Tr-811]|uniref:hypothetical protein n=1 Tax=Pantoea sp. Tr-811 TaxID=2608361 RepID=UPI0014247E6F|nr:hypothetical protein [Pantoea sp. Tr-811]NIF24797.1 hypothetical protein [Pantoea sp. Tr-811]